ncbi:MAG: acyltransferase family protein [Bdellovibrionales bacterium]
MSTILFQTIKNLSQPGFGDQSFITGLRAYAAFMVILIHAGGAGLREFGDIGNRIADLGAAGVYIFFVVSGFCISHSLTKNSEIKQFWWKRFWRVAPAYYCACLFGIITIVIGTPVSAWRSILGETNLLYDVLMHLSFLSFLDYRTANSLVGVEWSIPIEMFWYAVIPFALPLLRTWWTAILLFILTCAVFSIKFIYHNFVPPEVLGEAIKWSPIRYAPAFFLGLLAYKLRPWVSSIFKPWILDFGLLTLLIVGFFELIILQIGNEYINILLLTFGIILAGGKGPVSSFLFERKSMIFLGTISYSLYLTHMFVLHFLPTVFDTMPFVKFIAVSILTVIVSTLSYLFIERKGIQIGRNLYKKRLT